MSDFEIIELSDAGPELASAPFQTQTALTKIAMTTKPMGLIADMVSPVIPTPFKFTYTRINEKDVHSLPDNLASRAGRLNEVEYGSTDANDRTVDYGLLCFVPDRDVEEAKAQMLAYDPLATSTDLLATSMKLRREKRVADLVFYPPYYGTNRVTLVNEGQWSSIGSNPLANIFDRIDDPLVRPNALVMGQHVWTHFRRHPVIVEAVKSTGAGAIVGAPGAGAGGTIQAQGTVSKQQVADLFELDHVLVGSAQVQTANKGQDPVYEYLWGRHAALLHINRALSGPQTAMPSFTFTAQAMPMTVSVFTNKQRGIGAGSHVVKISESCKELISWPGAGFMFENAVAA